MIWILLGILVVAFIFYYARQQGTEVRQAEKRRSFEEAMSRQMVETIEVKDIVSEDPKGVQHTKEGMAYLLLPLRSSSGRGPQAVVIFGKKAEELAPKVRRGTRIRARGRPTLRKGYNQGGKVVERTELIANQVDLIGGPEPVDDQEQPQ